MLLCCLSMQGWFADLAEVGAMSTMSQQVRPAVIAQA